MESLFTIIRRNTLCNEIKDKRLLCSSQTNQPSHIQFRRQNAIESMRLKLARVKDNTLGGYNPYRGDFDIDYNNGAESLVVLASQLGLCCYRCEDAHVNEKSEVNLIENLQIALVEHYNSQLEERELRKNTIKRHGLMNKIGSAIWVSRLEASVGKSQAKKIIRLCSLTSAKEMELFTTSLELMNKKRAEVNKLTFNRTQRGITCKWDMNLFDSQRVKRERSHGRIDVRNFAMPVAVKKKKKADFEIFHLPRFKDLTPKECDLCCSNRLEPSFYLDVKDFLISDCYKNNGLLLKKARKLVRIDVNKTRKIFDLLLEEGCTWLPESKPTK